MLNFYDFEVFKHDWLVVIINPANRKRTVIVNSRENLIDYYEKHKDEVWVGWNSRNYDQFILKTILLGGNPKNTNDYLIGGGKGYQIDKRFKTIPLNDYDVKFSMNVGLKQVEGFMGNDIQESSVPFDIDRKLTREELDDTIDYCTHDVEQTIEIFLKRKSDFEAQMDLIRTFELPLSMVSMTKPQLTATIIGCRKSYHNDEFVLDIVDTLKIEKYKHVIAWFRDRHNLRYDASLSTDVCGIPHTFGWGGLHGCINKPIHRKGYLLHIDVTSFYPSIMIEYDFLTRNCRNKSKFKEIYDKRVELKKAGKKKEQAPYKIILNSTYGICKDQYSNAYDPRQANNVCVNGQLLLLDLLEHLEPYCELIQSNTDGVIIQIDDTDEAYQKIDDVCYEWEQRTKMSLGFDVVNEIWQKDVNNYILRFDNGKLERKGGYVKELDDLDNDLPIVNEAVVKFLTEGISPQKTIEECNELKMFQKIVRLSRKYKYAHHNGNKLNETTFRVFASLDWTDGAITKQKDVCSTKEKFANTPARCFIYNSNVNEKPIPFKLDKTWYIDLAVKRIADYGMSVNLEKQQELF